MFSSLESITKFGWPVKLNEKGKYASGTVVAELALAYQKLAEIVQLFYPLCVAAKNDSMLSSEGRAAASKKLGLETIAKLDSLGAMTVNRANTKIQALSAALRPAGYGSEPVIADVVHTLKVQEMRSMVRTELDNVGRDKLLSAAIDAGDDVTYEAIVEAPSFLNLLPAPIIAERKRDWLIRRNPTGAIELTDTQEALAVFNEGLANAKAEVGRFSGCIDNAEYLRISALARDANEAARKASDIGVNSLKGGA